MNQVVAPGATFFASPCQGEQQVRRMAHQRLRTGSWICQQCQHPVVQRGRGQGRARGGQQMQTWALRPSVGERTCDQKLAGALQCWAAGPARQAGKGGWTRERHILPLMPSLKTRNISQNSGGWGFLSTRQSCYQRGGKRN